MASKIVGITVDIEGKTSGLTKSLQEANSSINKTTSALKDVDKALQLDPTNVDLLAQKEALLNKQIEQTSDKLDIMKQVAEDANAALERGDITQEQYAQLTAEIVKTETALGQLEDEANGSADALDGTADAADNAGNEAEEASVDMEALGEAAEVAGEVAVAALEAIVVSAVAVGTAIVAAATEAGTALVNMTMETSKLSDELLTMSSTTGLSTDTLQELNYASELLDVSTETVTGSMTKLLRTMSSASDGSATAMEKFEDLGIAIYDVDGNLRSTEDVFWDAIDVLGQIDNETERDAAAMDLFGKSARELNPLIEAGSSAFADLAEEAHEVGYVMDSETLDAFGALDDNMQRMSNTAQAMEQSFGQVLLPLLTDMSGDAVSLMGEFSGALSETGGDIDQIASVIENFAPQAVALVEQYVPKILTIIQSVISAVIPVVMSLAPQLISLAGSIIEQIAISISENAESFISAFASLFESLTSSVAVLLPVLIPLAIELISALVSGLIDNASLLVEGALSIVDTLCDSLLSPDNVETLILGASSLITALLEGLTVALPKLIPAALGAILTIVDTLLSSGCLSQILEAALTLITTLAQSLIEYLPVLISYLPQIILGIVKFLTGDALPDIIRAGFTLITSLLGALPDILAAILVGLGELIAGMFEYITTDGADDILEAFQAAFDGIIAGASTWGSDIIQNLIDGITSMLGSLGDAVASAAQVVADFLHFSEPDKGPLSDFNESGADMVQNFIKSMESEQADLENALYDTASIINRGWDNSFEISANAAVRHTNDFDSGFANIQSAISSMPGADGGTWIFPIYIGGEHVDSLVVDALDRYNYQTGGH